MLSPRWLKVLRDLGGNKTRTALVVLSIAIGVFAMGMIGGTNVVLSDDMTNAYMSINPSSATIYCDPFDDDLVSSVRGMKGVAWVEGRRVIGLKMRGKGDTKISLQLTAIPDYGGMKVSKVFPQTGAFPPGQHEILLERASLSYLGLKVGDTITVEVSDTKTRALRVVGTVHDINTAPPIFVGAGFGYISMSTLEWLGAPQNLNQLEVLVSEGRLDKNHIQEVAAQVRDRVEKSGRTVYYTYVGNPGKHPVDSTMQAIVYLLGALGLVSLLLSGFLVVNTISALLTQQTRQIGVMKAIGARAGQITGMYLATVFAFGLLALCVGVPLGALGAYLMGGYMANLVNFDATSLTPTPHVLALEVAVGLGVPLVAALFPVLAGVRVTTREAMSTFGSSKAGFGAGRIDKVLERVRGVSRPLLLSLRNTFRRKGRLILTLSTLTLGGATFIAVFSVRDSTVLTLDQALQYFRYDLQVDFQKEYRTDYLLTQTLRRRVWLEPRA